MAGFTNQVKPKQSNPCYGLVECAKTSALWSRTPYVALILGESSEESMLLTTKIPRDQDLPFRSHGKPLEQEQIQLISLYRPFHSVMLELVPDGGP